MKDFLLNLFFPKKCVCCQKLDTFLCDECAKEIVFINSPTCIVCGNLSKKGRTCPRCRTKTKLNGVMISAYYEDGPVKELIHIYKYEGLRDLDKLLAGFLVETFSRCHPEKIQRGISSTGKDLDSSILRNDRDQLTQNTSKEPKYSPSRSFGSNFLLTYVPMHPKKEKQRGYNQSELLAKAVSEQTGFEMVNNLLIKTKLTIPQIHLKRGERLKNLEGAFEINQKMKNIIKGKKIILIDDIVTTGTTLNECAKILKENGAREVWGVVVGKH